jgi:hypothetical protein
MFIGDAWFRQDENEMDYTSQTEDNTSMEEVDSSPNDLKIDFEAESSEDAPTSKASSDDEALLENTPLLPTYTGLCRLLLAQAFPTRKAVLSVSEEEVLPYRAAVLKSLAKLLKSLDESVDGSGNAQKKRSFEYLSTKLAPIFDTETDIGEGKGSVDEPPLIVSKAIDCFAACFWDDFGSDEGSEFRHSNIFELSKIFLRCTSQEQPWTIREAALHGCARLVSKSHTSSLQHHATISTLVDCASQALKDRKFWKVRCVTSVFCRKLCYCLDIILVSVLTFFQFERSGLQHWSCSLL